MSLLSCYTRLNIVNCTGLPAKITIKSNDNLFMRIQPVDEANIEAEIATNADSVSEWVQEWFNLLRYGPTYDSFQWLLEGQTTESARLQLLSSLSISINWGDQSVNWQSQVDGIWTVDISKITEVTIYLKSDIGEYQKKHTKRLLHIRQCALPYICFVLIRCISRVFFQIVA